MGISIEDLTDDYDAGCEQMKWSKYVYSAGKMYELLEDRNVEEDDELIEATQDEEGIISYKLRWYNGGASFDEVFEEAVSRLPVKDDLLDLAKELYLFSENHIHDKCESPQPSDIYHFLKSKSIQIR